jgi:hypothetical protein
MMSNATPPAAGTPINKIAVTRLATLSTAA